MDAKMPQTCEVISRPKDFMFRAADGDIGDFEGEFHRLLLTLSGGSCGYEVDENDLTVCISQNRVSIAAFRPTDVADDSESLTHRSLRTAVPATSARTDVPALTVARTSSCNCLATAYSLPHASL